MKTLARATALALVALTLALVGLPAAAANGDDGKAGAYGKDNGKGHQHTYTVSVRNLTENQILTPPAFAVHTARADIFTVGQPASLLVQEIAENGNLTPLTEALPDVKGVRASGVGAGEQGPLLPGEDRWFDIATGRGARLFSSVQMVVCTNDGFAGIDAVQLPRKKGKSTKVYAFAWDAGTEVNTDALADFVPPCSGGTTGTDMSNPDLAEGGVIAPHPGLRGEAATMWAFDADAPVAVFEITRTSGGLGGAGAAGRRVGPSRAWPPTTRPARSWRRAGCGATGHRTNV